MENAFLRRVAGLLAVPLVAAVGAVAVTSTPAQAQGGLRDATNMLVGTAVTPGLLNNSQYANIVSSEFSSITAENDMKWETIQPSQGNYNFGPADEIVQFANQHGQNVYGHTLVWHSQAPNWLEQLSGSQLESAMQEHINTVMGRYAGDVQYWDVANEIVGDNGGQLRDSFWLQGLGEGYIDSAFNYARQADPGATLCLNDYSIDGINAKSDRYYQLVQDMQSRGTPIDCMGFQAHLILGQVPGNMQQNLQRFANLGLEVYITELDIRMNTPASNQQLEQQAQEYAEVFQICQNVGACSGVTVWGVHDAQSWIPDHFPGEGAALMWDDNFNPKPAYYAVLEQLGGSTPPPTTTPPTTTPPTTTPPTTPPPGGGGDCSVSYSADGWGGHPGYTASVTINNTGSSTINGWTLEYEYTAGQQVNDHWSASISQSGSTVTASDAGWNGNIGPGQSATFGYNGEASSAGNLPTPSSFSLNGTSCSVS